jgi:hypothetical protein
MAQPENLEVARMAHELQHSHGIRAFKYAAQLAADSCAEGQVDDHMFWNAVETALHLLNEA